VVLADEINRAPAKVQSALLEAMEERQVTLGGETLPLPDPFLVLATQNPLEHQGTYPLAEAQLDRFLMMLRVSYPGREEEALVLRRAALDFAPELRKLCYLARGLELLVKRVRSRAETAATSTGLPHLCSSGPPFSRNSRTSPAPTVIEALSRADVACWQSSRARGYFVVCRDAGNTAMDDAESLVFYFCDSCKWMYEEAPSSGRRGRCAMQ